MLGRMRLEKVLGDIASWRWPILVAKSPHMGGGAIWTSWPTLCIDLWPVAASRGDKAFLPGIVLPCHCSRRWRLLGSSGRRYLMEFVCFDIYTTKHCIR
jgi:hypothetical protein